MNRHALLVLGLFAFLGISGRAEGDVPWRRIRIPVECSQRGTTSTCLLRLSRSDMRDVAVEVPTGDQDVGFRLYYARFGRWVLAAEGAWPATPASWHEIRDPQSMRGGPVRLELTGELRPPRLLGATVAVREPSAAAAAGKSPRQIPAPDRNLLPLENAWFPAAWPVRAEGAQPGDTVHLDLPEEVLRQLGGRGLGSLRLATPRGYLPSSREFKERPRREIETADVRLVPAERPGWLRLSIPARTGPAYSQVHLTAPPRPLLRRVSVAGAEETWSCVPTPPLPCRLELDLEGGWAPPRELPKIEVEGGEGRPLPPLEVSVWSRSETLTFAWPAQGPVRLLAGNGSILDLGYDTYPDIPGAPSKSAVLGPEENASRFRRWTLGGAAMGTLILAGLCWKEWRWRRLLAAALLLSLFAAQAQGQDASAELALDLEAGRPQGNLSQDFALRAEWPVRTSRAAAGEVVRLEFPPEVYFQTGSLDQLRLETAGRQIPYVLRSLGLTVPVARRRITPAGDQTVLFPVSSSMTLTGWRLETRAPVSALFWFVPWELYQSTPKGSSNGSWHCTPGPRAPCIWEIGPGQGGVTGAATASVHAYYPPTGDIDVILWRQRQELVFVWPEKGEVRLLAGRAGTAAATYDLYTVQDRLLARPWQPAWLGRGQGHLVSEPAQEGLRMTLFSAAALILLFAVHRMMPRRS